jgi:UDP-glucose 4-epimerase
MKTALVTGGAGFIGSAVARALRARGIDVTIAGTSSQRDPLDPQTLPSVDAIIHCAGGSSVAASIQDPAADFAKTVPPVRALLERLCERPARLVLVSSAAVYGNTEHVPIPETAALAPVSPYGEHKQQCEQLCIDYGRRGVASTIVRLFSVYGPGLKKQLLWDACRKLEAGNAVFGGTGEEQRDWLHVDDAASLLVVAAERASSEVTIVNGGSGDGTRVRDVVEMISRELGAGAPTFSGGVRPGDPPRYIADITRARAFGWQPTVDLARGIREYVAWFREQG